MDSLSPAQAQTVLVVFGSLAALGGVVFSIVRYALKGYRWLQAEFAQLSGAIAAVQLGINERFSQHERDEHAWQGEMNAKLEDVRERMARIEGALSERRDREGK